MAIFCPGSLGTWLLVSTVHRLVKAAPEPRPASWAREPIGPDGPWNAVEVSIGDSRNKVPLFPGRVWHSFVITPEYCALNASVNHCEAGTYSTKGVDPLLTPVQFRPPAQEWMAGVRVAGKASSILLDTIDLQFKDDKTDVVPDVGLAIVTSQLLEYPSGMRYPAFAGCLSLGAPGANQSFDQASGPPLNGSIIPWYLAGKNATPSSSFGLHIGSGVPSARVPGSLLWGGYDGNRVVGEVLTLDGDFSRPVLLKDISVTVVKGASPFSFSDTQRGLLAAGNVSISASAGLPVVLDPCSPYLSLPRSTCDAIAAHLPVTFSPALGLYLWDRGSGLAERIISSAPALSFTLMGQTNTQQVTIHVPFRHLNLSLTRPLLPEGADADTVAYFPCYTASGTGASVLGRAFLQDAFLGASWHSAKVWLAQAPGPNVQPGSHSIAIGARGVAIHAGANDWLTSWDGFWTALNPAQANGTGAVPPPVGSRTGLSTGGKAGLAVGVVLAVVISAGAGFVTWKRRGSTSIDSVEGGWKMPWRWSSGPAEVEGDSIKLPGEVDGTGSRSLRDFRWSNRSVYELA